MRLRNRVFSILNYFLLTPIAILRGKRICTHRFSDSSTLYVLAFQGIGDSMVTLGYLPEYARKNGFQKALIFYTENYGEFYSFYDFDFAEKRVVSPRLFKTLKRFFSTASGLSYLLAHKNILFADTAVYLGGGWKSTFKMGEISVFSYIKKAIMGLYDEAKITLPKIPEIPLSEIFEHQDFSARKIAVLNTHSNTIQLASPCLLFEEIATSLKNKGYFIITDLGRNTGSESVGGTQAFFGTLAQSFRLCEKASLIVGVRSGYLDLMTLTGTPVFTIYPDDDEVSMNAFDLNSLSKISGRTSNKMIFQCRAKNALAELKKIS